jgi:hypothetical protein
MESGAKGITSQWLLQRMAAEVDGVDGFQKLSVKEPITNLR